jgi:hypothetical protein
MSEEEEDSCQYSWGLLLGVKAWVQSEATLCTP